MKRAGEEGTMERTTRPARSEFSLLPWMIAKAVGGVAAARVPSELVTASRP